MGSEPVKAPFRDAVHPRRDEVLSGAPSEKAYPKKRCKRVQYVPSFIFIFSAFSESACTIEGRCGIKRGFEQFTIQHRILKQLRCNHDLICKKPDALSGFFVLL